MTETFLQGVVFGAVLLGFPRLFWGTYTIYDSRQGGWVFKWQTSRQVRDAEAAWLMTDTPSNPLTD